MARILKVQHLERHVRVELDNGEKLLIPHSVAGMYRLEAGREPGPEEYLQLKEESSLHTCWNKSLGYLAIRARSAREIEMYLSRKAFSGDVIHKTMDRLREAGLIDDFDFAVRYIKAKMKRKAMGKNLLIRELNAKGISREILRRAIHEAGADVVDIERVYETALAKYHSLEGKKNRFSRLSFFLAQRGFDGETVKRVLERIRKDEGGD